MQYKIICDGVYPSLNEYINKINRNHFVGNTFKKSNQNQIELYVFRYLNGVHIKEPVFIKYKYYEKNKKRDLDNIAGFFHKIFQDALTARGVLSNDGWANIIGFEDRFYIDKNRPRVEIEITTAVEGSGEADKPQKALK